MTVAELEQWAIQHGWSEQRLSLARLYPSRFTVVPSSPDLCRKWAEVTVAVRSAGRRIECADGWIAATAVPYSAPLVTHNRNDYPGASWASSLSFAKRIRKPQHS